MFFPKEIDLKKITLKNNIMTAPLAGYSDIPYLNLMKNSEVSLLFTEMISIEALWRENQKTLNMIPDSKIFKDNPYICVQLFGNKSDSYKKSIDIVENKYNYSFINLNMGCPVPKVLKSKAGCYYLKDLDDAKRVIKDVRKYTDGILSIKTRLGLKKGDLIGKELCKIAEGEGVDFVIVHARTYKQGFSGTIDLDELKDLSESINIPVIGNGDINSLQDADDMIKKGCCDGLMIGRGCYGNPGLIDDLLHNDSSYDMREFFKQHVLLILDYYGDERGYRNVKKFIPYYKNLFSKKEKIAILTSLSYDSFRKTLKDAGIEI